MRKNIVFVLTVGLLASIFSPVSAQAIGESSAVDSQLANAHISNQVLFSVEPGTNPRETVAGRFASSFELIAPDTYAAKVHWWLGLKLAMVEMLTDPEIIFVEPNLIVQPAPPAPQMGQGFPSDTLESEATRGPEVIDSTKSSFSASSLEELPPTYGAPEFFEEGGTPVASWQIPPVSAGVITSQLLRVSSVGGAILDIPLALDADWHYLPGLIPNISYTVSIAGVNDAGVGVFSEPSEPKTFLHTADEYLLWQWGLLSDGYGADAIGAWDQGVVGSNDIYVGVIDSGIQVDHPDLINNIWVNAGEIPGNGIDDDGNGFIDDVNGWNFADNSATMFVSPNVDDHGTHVAGIIGASANATGVMGVAQNVEIIPVKIFGDHGATSLSIVRALEYLLNLKVSAGLNIVATNNSYGGPTSSSLLAASIARQGDAGILFVAAAGNETEDNDAVASYPANYECETEARRWDCVISVASIDSDGNISSFSNYGQESVDLAAPGGNFRDPADSELSESILSTYPIDTFDFMPGTSMAAPFVTGAVVLCAAANPGLNASQIRELILANVNPLPANQPGLIASGGALNISATVAACVTAETALEAPSSVKASPTGTPNQILLTWMDNSAQETGYKIYMGDATLGVSSRICTGDSLTSSIATLSPNQTSLLIPLLTDAHTYCFGVSAIKGDNESDQSLSNALISPGSSVFISVSGRVTLNDGFTPVANALVTWNFSTYIPTGVFTDRDGFYEMQVDNDLEGTIRVSGPSGHNTTEVQTVPTLPKGLNVIGRASIRLGTTIDISLPKLRQVQVHLQHDIDTPVPNRAFELSITGGDFRCYGAIEVYRPSSGMSFETPPCMFSPNGPLGEMKTDQNGDLTLYLLDSANDSLSTLLSLSFLNQDQEPVSTTILSEIDTYSLVQLRPGFSFPQEMPAPALSATQDEVRVSWVQLAESGGMPIISYEVLYRGVGDGLEETSYWIAQDDCLNLIATSTTCTVTGLASSTRYTVLTRAITGIGSGWGIEASINTLAPAAILGGGGGGGGAPAAAKPEQLSKSYFLGSVTSGSRVTADVGTWQTSENLLFKYQWHRCNKELINPDAATVQLNCSAVFAAEQDSYLVTESDKDKHLLLEVIARDKTGKLIGLANVFTNTVKYGVTAIKPAITTPVIDSGETKSWTKRLVGNTQAKLYAKNIIGAGKVVFRLNGKQIAWINAIDGTDPKLRTAAGAQYLVRTINLGKGKNVLEVFTDGKRTTRTVYSR
jgi:subtilisin family serine protease